MSGPLLNRASRLPSRDARPRQDSLRTYVRSRISNRTRRGCAAIVLLHHAKTSYGLLLIFGHHLETEVVSPSVSRAVGVRYRRRAYYALCFSGLVEKTSSGAVLDPARVTTTPCNASTLRFNHFSNVPSESANNRIASAASSTFK